MPIYEFKCDDCQEKFELLCQKGATGEGEKCPSCSSDKIKKQLSLFCASSKVGKGESAANVPLGGMGGCSSCSGGSCGSCH